MTITDQDTQNGPTKAPHRVQGEGLSGTSEAAEVVYGAADMAQRAREGEVAVKGLETISSEWIGWAQDAYSANVKAWIALLGCRSIYSVGAIQSALLGEQTKIFSDHRRMSLTVWNSTLKYNKNIDATI